MIRETAWMEDALCRQVDIGELFYPEVSTPNPRAKAVCSTCPVIAECLKYALANGEAYGVWGGTSANQRRRMPGWTPRPSYELTAGSLVGRSA